MTTKTYYFTVKVNEFTKETLYLTTDNIDDGLQKYWYWRYDPLRLMPLMLSLSMILGVTIAFPFAVIGIVANFIRNLCSTIIINIQGFDDNYTIIDSIEESVVRKPAQK